MYGLNFAQLVGLIGFLIGVTGLLQKKDRDIRMRMGIFAAVMSLHFLLLGSISSAVGSGVGSARSFASLKTNSVKVAFAFIALLWLLGLPNIDSFVQLIPLIGTSVATYGFFAKSGLSLRFMLLFNSSCWLFNNILIGSIGGMMAEATFFSVNLFMIIRIWNQSRLAHHFNEADG